MRQTKKVSVSATEQQYILRPAHINPYGRLFGAQLLKWIDEVAGIVAVRHANAIVTTAAIDNLQFKEPAYAGDLIVLTGRVTYVGRSSMEVRVDTYVEKSDGMRYPINRAHIVLVALDENNQPAPIPALIPETDVQREEYLMAKKRRELRLERQKNGF